MGVFVQPTMVTTLPLPLSLPLPLTPTLTLTLTLTPTPTPTPTLILTRCLLHPGGYQDATIAVPAWAREQLRAPHAGATPSLAALEVR